VLYYVPHQQLGSSLSRSVQAGQTSLIGLPWPPRHGIELQPKLQPCHQLGNLCHPGWTRHLIPSGDRKPLVMCGHGPDGKAPLRLV
jgi:hypothetical protein